MGVTKQTLIPGNNTDFPKPGSTCAIDYTGALYDPSKTDNHFMGKQYVHTYHILPSLWISQRAVISLWAAN